MVGTMRSERHVRPTVMHPRRTGVDQTALMDAASGEYGRIFSAFRQWGYLLAKLDPLGRVVSQVLPELEVSGEAAKQAHRYYCSSIGVEFTHIPQVERRQSGVIRGSPACSLSGQQALLS